jgi:hypothetical protein
MPFTYRSGDQVKRGDRVLFHGEPGEIAFVADPLISDPDTHWYVEEYGGGVMVLEPKSFGLVFLSKPDTAEDLELVRRASGPAVAGASGDGSSNGKTST